MEATERGDEQTGAAGAPSGGATGNGAEPPAAAGTAPGDATKGSSGNEHMRVVTAPAAPDADSRRSPERADEGAPEPTAKLAAVLAGGRGSRLGGEKATVELAGRPLISYALAALAAAGLDPFVVAKPNFALGVPPRAEPDFALGTSPRAKPDTVLGGPPPAGPDQALAAVEIITEPAEPTHPLAGIIAALRHADRPLVILGCDFPFAPPPLLRALADATEPLVVPAPAGAPQPLMARWSPDLLPTLEAALAREEPLRRTVAALDPHLLEDADLAPFGDPGRAFFNVNTPEDLRTAATLL